MSSREILCLTDCAIVDVDIAARVDFYDTHITVHQQTVPGIYVQSVPSPMIAAPPARILGRPIIPAPPGIELNGVYLTTLAYFIDLWSGKSFEFIATDVMVDPKVKKEPL